MPFFYLVPHSLSYIHRVDFNSLQPPGHYLGNLTLQCMAYVPDPPSIPDQESPSSSRRHPRHCLHQVINISPGRKGVRLARQKTVSESPSRRATEKPFGTQRLAGSCSAREEFSFSINCPGIGVRANWLT